MAHINPEWNKKEKKSRIVLTSGVGIVIFVFITKP